VHSIELGAAAPRWRSSGTVERDVPGRTGGRTSPSGVVDVTDVDRDGCLSAFVEAPRGTISGPSATAACPFLKSR
jgi:hypothetical protein